MVRMSSDPLPMQTFSSASPCSLATAARSGVLFGFGYSRSDAPSSPRSRTIASATRGLGGYGHSFVLSFTQPGSVGWMPGV